MMNSAYEVPPDGSANAALQEALRQLAVLNAENTRLRQQMFDANEKYDDMSMCHRVTEIELKHAMKKDAEIFEKELSIRNRDLALLNRDHSGILKQLATLKQQQFLQQKQQQLLMKKQIFNNDNGTDTSNSSGRLNMLQGSITNGSFGPNQTIDVPRNTLNQQSQSLSVNSNLSLSLSSQSINSKSGIYSKGSNGSISNNNVNINRVNNNSINNNGNNNNNSNNISSYISNNSSNNSSYNNNNIHDKHSAYDNSSTASIHDVKSFTGRGAASVQSDKAVNLLATAASTATASDRCDKKHIPPVNVPDPVVAVSVAALGVNIAASNTTTTTAAAAVAAAISTAPTTSAAAISTAPTTSAAVVSSASAPVLKAICSEVMENDMKPAASGVGLLKPVVAPVLISDVRDANAGPLGTSDILDDLRNDVTYMSTLLPLHQDLLKSTTLLLKSSSSMIMAFEDKSIGSRGKNEFNVSAERLNRTRSESFGDSDNNNNTNSNSSNSTLSHLIDTVQKAFNSFLQNQSTTYSGCELIPLGEWNTSEQKASGKPSMNLKMASSVCALARCLLAMSVRRCYGARTNDCRIYRNSGEDFNGRSRAVDGMNVHGIDDIHGCDKEKEKNIGKNNCEGIDDRVCQPEQESLLLSLQLVEFLIEHFRKDEISQGKKARKLLLSSQVFMKSFDQDMKERVPSSSSSSFIQHKDKDRSRDRNSDSQATMDLNSKFENVAGINHTVGSSHSTYVTTESEGKTLQKRKSISKFNGNGSVTVYTSKDNLYSPGAVLMNTMIKERSLSVAGHRGLAVTRGLSGSGKKSSVSFAERGHITPVTGTHTHTGYGEDSRRGSADGDSAPPSSSTTHDLGSSVSCKRPRLLGPKHAISVATGLSYFPLSSLVMPGVSGDVLKSLYDDAAAANRIEDSTHTPNIEDPRDFYPLKGPKLSGISDAIGRLPGDLVELVGDLSVLLNILSTSPSPLPHTSQDIQHDKHNTVWSQSSSSKTYDQNRYQSSLLDAAVSLLGRMFKGDYSASSICSGDDLIPLLGSRSFPSTPTLNDNTVEERNNCSLLSLFSFSFSSSPSSATSSSISVLNHRNNCVIQGGENDEEKNYSDALQLLERNAFCEINAELSEHEKHQLTSESSLLLILLELLKNKKAFKCFLTYQNKLNISIHAHVPMYVDRKQPQNYTGYNGYNGRRLISHLCRRLLLNVSDSHCGSGKSSGESRGRPGEVPGHRQRQRQGEGPTERATFSMATIKLKIVYFITGIIETYGKDGVAAVFGVAVLPVSPVLSMGDMGGTLKEGGGKGAGVGTKTGAGLGSGSSCNRRIGSQDPVDSGIELRSVRESEDITRVDNTAVHCLCVCWTLSTRSLHLAPHTLSPADRLIAELVDGIGRVLDLMAGQMTPKEWSYLITLEGDVDDEMISRQMSQRALCSVHPVVLKMCKDNPLVNLW